MSGRMSPEGCISRSWVSGAGATSWRCSVMTYMCELDYDIVRAGVNRDSEPAIVDLVDGSECRGGRTR